MSEQALKMTAGADFHEETMQIKWAFFYLESTNNPRVTKLVRTM